MRIYKRQTNMLVRLTVTKKGETPQSITFDDVESVDDAIKEIHPIFSDFLMPDGIRTVIQFREFSSQKNQGTKSFPVYGISVESAIELITNKYN